MTMPPRARLFPRQSTDGGSSHSSNRDLRARTYEPAQPRRIPVRQADAAVRFAPSDGRGLGSAVKAEMFFVDVDPHHAHRVIRPGSDFGFGVLFVRVPE